METITGNFGFQALFALGAFVTIAILLVKPITKFVGGVSVSQPGLMLQKLFAVRERKNVTIV